MSTHHYLVGALAVFEASENVTDYYWEDFEKWAEAKASSTDVHSLLGSNFMKIQCPPVISSLMSSHQLFSLYESEFGLALERISNHFSDAASLSSVDAGIRTKSGSRSRWTPTPVSKIYIDAMFESWALNSLYRAFELSAVILHVGSLPKKTNKDYTELAVALLLARDFDQYLSQ
jgi:hypothetical protein